MTSHPLGILVNALTDDAPLNTATSRAILEAVGRGEMGETLEIGTSTRVVAFGKHDSTSPRFADAVQTAVDHGFQPTVRIVGGRAAVFHETTLRFGWTRPVEDRAKAMSEGFDRITAMVTDTLANFGIHGIVGEIPGEYCPGANSVHIAGRKVMGVGQRLVRNAAHVGGVVVMSNGEVINEVLVPIYDLLGLPLDPSVTGSVADALPLTTTEFAEAFVATVAGGRPTIKVAIPEAVRQEALRMRPDHDPVPRGGPSNPATSNPVTSNPGDTCTSPGHDQDSPS